MAGRLGTFVPPAPYRVGSERGASMNNQPLADCRSKEKAAQTIKTLASAAFSCLVIQA